MNTVTNGIYSMTIGYLFGAERSRGVRTNFRLLNPILSLLVGIATTTTVQAFDFPGLDEAIPRGGNSVKYAPVFDFDGDGCLPSAGISRQGVKNPGLKPTGSITGQCRSPYFLGYSNTVHRYACISSGGSNYCGHFYSLYFEKDQCYGPLAIPDPVCGHRHDWEYAAVWTKDGVVTHGSVSAHGDLETRTVFEVPFEGDHLKVVYHKDGLWTHAMRFAKWGEFAENPYGSFVTPALATWYGLKGDNISNQEMREKLNAYCYWCDSYGGGTIPLIDSQLLVNLNKFKPSSYPAFTEASVNAANPNNPVLTMKAEGDGTFYVDDIGYLVDFGIVHKPLIGNRWLMSEFVLINQVSEPADMLDGYFDISAAAPFLTTGFNQFTGLAAGDSISGLIVEISTAGYAPGLVVGVIEFQPKGMIDTGARELLDPITLQINLEIAPPVDDIVADLPRGSIRTEGNRNALWNFLKQARANAQRGNKDQARKKLQQALERTDGCVLRDSADTKAVAPLAKDYIVNCPDQELVYALIKDELNALALQPRAGANLQEATTRLEASTSSDSGGGGANLWFLVLLWGISLLSLKRGK